SSRASGEPSASCWLRLTCAPCAPTVALPSIHSPPSSAWRKRATCAASRIVGTCSSMGNLPWNAAGAADRPGHVGSEAEVRAEQERARRARSVAVAALVDRRHVLLVEQVVGVQAQH